MEVKIVRGNVGPREYSISIECHIYATEEQRDKPLSLS